VQPEPVTDAERRGRLPDPLSIRAVAEEVQLELHAAAPKRCCNLRQVAYALLMLAYAADPDQAQRPAVAAARRLRR
jgi:hypothetical protein